MLRKSYMYLLAKHSLMYGNDRATHREYFGDIYKSVVQGLRPQLRRAVQEGSNEDLREV